MLEETIVAQLRQPMNNLSLYAQNLKGYLDNKGIDTVEVQRFVEGILVNVTRLDNELVAKVAPLEAQLTRSQGRIAELEKLNSDLTQLVNLGTVDWEGLQQKQRIAELEGRIRSLSVVAAAANGVRYWFEHYTEAGHNGSGRDAYKQLCRALDKLPEQQPTTGTSQGEGRGE